MYQQTTFGCKRTDSSEDTVDTAESYILIIRALAVSMTLKTEKNTFLLDLLAPNDAPPHQVWLQNVERLRVYPLDKVQTNGKTDKRLDVHPVVNLSLIHI